MGSCTYSGILVAINAARQGATILVQLWSGIVYTDRDDHLPVARAIPLKTFRYTLCCARFR